MPKIKPRKKQTAVNRRTSTLAQRVGRLEGAVLTLTHRLTALETPADQRDVAAALADLSAEGPEAPPA